MGERGKEETFTHTLPDSTSTATPQRLAVSLQQQCQRQLQLSLTRVPKYSPNLLFSRFSFGEPSLINKDWKTILLVGATGSGKTTLINSMMNYILGVEWQDDFRFKLIDEQLTEFSETESQTKRVTAYDIHYKQGLRIPYSLTIVDTPGFGANNGDQEIINAIRELFASRGDSTQKVDAVGFVLPSSIIRLTPAQKFIFESLLDIFGDDIKDNISFLFTFSDGQKPAVIKTVEMPCKLDANGQPIHHLFNNSALYVSNKTKDCFSKLFWQLNTDNLKSFFDELAKLHSKSLQPSPKMLQENGMKLLEECAKEKPSVIEINRLIQMGADVNLKNDEGNTPLLALCSIRERNYDVFGCVKALLGSDRGVEVNAKTNDGARNALFLLCWEYAEENLIEIINLLIQHGIDVTCQDDYGANALQFACSYYRNENLIAIVRLFIQHGVNVGHKDNGGRTALYFLQNYNGGNKSEIELLLKPNE